MIEHKKTTYNKILNNNLSIIVMIVVILASFFYSNIVRATKDNNLYINGKIAEDTVSYIENIKNRNDYINQYLYESNTELADMVQFLQLNEEAYLDYRLQEYSQSNRTTYYGTSYFMEKVYEMSEQVVEAGIYSYVQNRYTKFFEDGAYKTTYLPNSEGGVEQIGLKDREIRFTQSIKDPHMLDILGEISIVYTLEPLDQYAKQYPQHHITILDDKGYIIYDSKGEREGESYPYLIEGRVWQKEIEDRTGSFVDVQDIDATYTVITAIQARDATHVPMALKMSFVMISFGLILIGGIGVYMKLSRLDKRMKRLLDAMAEVEQGKFDVSIIDDEEDELAVISASFNRMCQQLDTYIQRSYLAKIRQKNTEMKVLQNQINPHFLYNTLESIRMKAICNGDREVGKMLQNLAIIFRSQIKEDDIISIAKELHYCKKYMELFTFRYENQFTFDIICEEIYLHKKIVKFSLQPIIENYFVHGIRLEDTDNHIEIVVSGNEKVIALSIADNGRGMPKEQVTAINEQLRKCEYEGDSIGIINVQERVVGIYGREYGLVITPNRKQGVEIILKLPNQEDE